MEIMGVNCDLHVALNQLRDPAICSPLQNSLQYPQKEVRQRNNRQGLLNSVNVSAADNARRPSGKKQNQSASNLLPESDSTGNPILLEHAPKTLVCRINIGQRKDQYGSANERKEGQSHRLREAEPQLDVDLQGDVNRGR